MLKKQQPTMDTKNCNAQHSASVMGCGISVEDPAKQLKLWKMPAPSSCYDQTPPGGTPCLWLWKGSSRFWERRESQLWERSVQNWRFQCKFELCIYLFFYFWVQYSCIIVKQWFVFSLTGSIQLSSLSSKSTTPPWALSPSPSTSSKEKWKSRWDGFFRLFPCWAANWKK